MKFIVSTSSLSKQLQLISGVISNNTVLPILEDFLFDIQGNKLTIYATDLETSMSTELEIEAKEEGKVAIPAKILVDTLKTLPEQPLTFSINEETNAVEVTTDKGKFKLAGENGDDFPRIPQPEDANSLTINSSVLGRAVNKTVFAVSNDELRPAMTGVYFLLEPDGITFVATDAHRLVKFRHLDTEVENPTNFIVPRKALGLLKGALPSEETQVTISYNDSNVFFNFGNVSLVCRLIDAKFPDYNAVIPTENPNRLTVNRADLLNTLRRISIFSNKSTNQVMVRLTGSELNIFAQDIDFSNEADERMNCDYEGEDIEIGFNGRFLQDMLSAMENDEIVIEMSTPTRAGIILPTEQDPGEDLLMLVMPVMMGN